MAREGECDGLKSRWIGRSAAKLDTTSSYPVEDHTLLRFEDGMKTCSVCGRRRRQAAFMGSGSSSKCRECFLEWNRKKSADDYAKNRDRRLADMRSRYEEHRRMVLMHYGQECSCCGEDEPMFLTIDHINNDGRFHRKRHGTSSHHNIYGWLVRNKMPKQFQVLCMNCNTGKHRNGGTCPHVKKVQRLGRKARRSKRSEARSDL